MNPAEAATLWQRWLAAEGWTLKEMAAEFGCDLSTVSFRVLRHGLR